MTDKTTEQVISEIVKFEKRTDKLLRQPVESEEEYHTRMQLEEAFLGLQRELFKYCTGRDMGVINNYYEASGFTGIGKILSAQNDLEVLYILETIIGEEIKARAEKYTINQDKKKNKAILKEYLLYHPDVLFAGYTPFVMEKDSGTNFYVVKKSMSTRRELGKIIERGEEMARILSYGDEYYLRADLMPNPWEEVIKNIQGIIARAEPMRDLPYLKTGRVIEWTNRDLEGYHPAGMLVKPIQKGESIVLKNCTREMAQKLQEKSVRYWEKGAYLSMGCDVGELIATQLSIPIPFQKQITIR